MYFRLHNSCTYFIYENHFELRSDIFGMLFRFKGLSSKSANCLMKRLQDGIAVTDSVRLLSTEAQCEEAKVKKLIDFFITKGLLIKRQRLVNMPTQDTLYDRQIRFLDTFENPAFSGFDFNEKLQERKVIIIGLGAYGSWLALHCARMGIKHIIGIDFDTVELSNLHRQVLYTRDDIGFSKADACAKLLTSVDHTIKYEGICKKIENENDLIPFLEQADLVFNAFGYYSEEEAMTMIPGFITKACIKTATPMLCLSTNWVGPLYINGHSACYFCATKHPELEPMLRRNIRNPRVDKRAFCPILSLSCSLAALEAARYLSGISQPQSVDGIIALDPFQMHNSSFVSVPINQKCAHCNN